MASGKLVHAIPQFIRGREGAGNWKDVTSRLLLWDQLGIPFDVIYFDEEEPQTLIHLLPPDARHVLIEYSWWPDIVRTASGQGLDVHVRTHNAEAWQQWVRDEVAAWPTYRNLRSLYGLVRLLYRDSRCRRFADTLLGISEWDNRRYWKLLPGTATVRYLPYYSPWPFLKEDRPRPYVDRPRLILSMPGANDAIGRSVVDGFARLAGRIRNEARGKDWQFVLSEGIIGARDRRAIPEWISTQAVESPWCLLGSARAVAVLSDLGFGLKTTIVDALAAGCHVLVSPGLAARLPTGIREHCCVLSSAEIESPGELLVRLEAPPERATKVNDRLRTCAVRVLRETLGLLSAAQRNAPPGDSERSRHS